MDIGAVRYPVKGVKSWTYMGRFVVSKFKATCEFVKDGNTFQTAKKNLIRLARYNIPAENTPNYLKAKHVLESLILKKEVFCEQVGTPNDHIIAEVWQSDININDMMLRFSPTK